MRHFRRSGCRPVRSARPVHTVPLEVRRTDSLFIRGDANDDGKVNLADAVWILGELMRSGPSTRCPEAADVNDDGARDVSDAVYLLQYRFLHGPTIPYPHPRCGADAFGVALGCAAGSVDHCRG